MDATFYDSFRDVHSASDGLIVGGLHPIVFGQFIDLNLVAALSVSLQGGLLMMSHLSKLSNISNLLPLQAAEVCSDSTVLQIDNTSEGLIEKRSDRGHRKVASFGSEGMDHGLEAHVDFSGADDLGDVCFLLARAEELTLSRGQQTAGIIGLKKCHLDAFVGEVSQLLGKVNGCMVWRRVPMDCQLPFFSHHHVCYQFIKKVILSVDILTSYSRELNQG